MAKIDIMGLALRDYLKGVRDQTFICRDDGFSDREPIERYFKGFAEWSQVEQRLLAELSGTVLETGCSRGEHLHYLQERGIDATGIDISPNAIQLTQEAGVKNCLVMDAREMKFERRFDMVLMLYYGFGLGGTVESQKQLLQALYRLTTENGKIIASSIDALKTNAPQHLAYQEFNRQKDKAYGDVTQVTLRLQHRDHFGSWYDLLFVNPKGLTGLVSGTGWQIVEVIPEKEGSRSWYYVLRK
jgi:SAM-dependent methyltransferase